MVSPRWNPTPEQLHALNDMYQRGTKTPSAQQIQLIAAKLRRFGRIEGKNVFYWFQNHKARDRQRQRLLRHSSLSMALGNDHTKPKPMMHHGTLSSVVKETPAATGLGKIPFEVGQTEIWASLSNSSTLSEESLLLQQGAVVSQCKTETRDLTQHLEEEITRRETQTLPLFPTSRDDYNTIYNARSGTELPLEAGITTFAPPKIFEFFPLSLGN